MENYPKNKRQINNKHPENIPFILFTFLVIKLERFNCFNNEHPLNMQLILVTLLVLKLERFNSVNDEHPLNI